VGPVAQIVTHYGLDGPGSNPGGARISARPDRPWGPPSLVYNGYRVFPGGKVRPGRAADHSPPSSAADPPSGPHRACNGITLPLPFCCLLILLVTKTRIACYLHFCIYFCGGLYSFLTMGAWSFPGLEADGAWD